MKFASGGSASYVPEMKFRLPFFLLAVLVIGLATYLIRNDFNGPVEPPISDSGPPIEEQLRDAIRVPAATEMSVTVVEKEEPASGPTLELSRGKLAWEATIESVTNAQGVSDAEKARRLFAMVATLPEPAMTTATEEAVKRLPDADYDAVALPLIANPQTHGLVESVLFDDVMRRPDAIALPALLLVARVPNHPYAKFARENLDLLIGEDFGVDWPKWEIAVKNALAAEK